MMGHGNNIRKYAGAVASAAFLALWGCGHGDEPGGGAPDGYVEVGFTVGGNYDAPLMPRVGGEAAVTRAITDITQADPHDIPDSTTLWLSAQEVADKAGSSEVGNAVLKQYVVLGGTLYPCVADDDGNLVSTTASPLYLPSGKYYRFKALGPARKLVDGKSLYIDNGQYVIANDDRDRYNNSKVPAEKRTGSRVIFIDDRTTDDSKVKTIELNPLINQTARLKFTLYADPADGHYVHTLAWQPNSLEIGGLQNVYNKSNAGSEPWNWTLCEPKDTLIAYPGNKNTKLVLTNLTSSSETRLECETGILPTDAYATPVSVIFNVKVNGVPTMFEMMLNRKLFLAGYSYNYRGRVKIEGGITVLEWQNLSWDQEVPIL